MYLSELVNSTSPKARAVGSRLASHVGLLAVLLGAAFPGVAAAARVSGLVAGTEGAGAAGVQVAALPTGGGSAVATTETGVGGTYSLAVPDGSYTFRFTPTLGDGLTTVVNRDEVISEDRAIDVRFAEPGQLAAALHSGYSFAGRLLTAAGAPVAGARIYATPESPSCSSGVDCDRYALTAADGSFAIPLPLGGTANVSIQLPANNEADNGTPSLETSVNITGHLHQTLTLPPTSSVSVKPESSTGFSATSWGWQLSSQCSNLHLAPGLVASSYVQGSNWSGASGSVSVIDCPTTAKVTASGGTLDGRALEPTTISFTPSAGTTSIVVPHEATPVIRGTLSTTAGEALAYAQVCIEDTCATASKTGAYSLATAATSGSLRISGYLPGSHFEVTTASIIVPPDGTAVNLSVPTEAVKLTFEAGGNAVGGLGGLSMSGGAEPKTLETLAPGIAIASISFESGYQETSTTEEAREGYVKTALSTNPEGEASVTVPKGLSEYTVSLVPTPLRPGTVLAAATKVVSTGTRTLALATASCLSASGCAIGQVVNESGGPEANAVASFEVTGTNPRCSSCADRWDQPTNGNGEFAFIAPHGESLATDRIKVVDDEYLTGDETNRILLGVHPAELEGRPIVLPEEEASEPIFTAAGEDYTLGEVQAAIDSGQGVECKSRYSTAEVADALGGELETEIYESYERKLRVDSDENETCSTYGLPNFELTAGKDTIPLPAGSGPVVIDAHTQAGNPLSGYIVVGERRGEEDALELFPGEFVEPLVVPRTPGATMYYYELFEPGVPSITNEADQTVSLAGPKVEFTTTNRPTPYPWTVALQGLTEPELGNVYTDLGGSTKFVSPAETISLPAEWNGFLTGATTPGLLAGATAVFTGLGQVALAEPVSTPGTIVLAAAGEPSAEESAPGPPPPTISSVTVIGASHEVVELAASGSGLEAVESARCGSEPAASLTVEGGEHVTVRCTEKTGSSHLFLVSPSGSSAEDVASAFSYPAAKGPSVSCASPPSSWQNENVTVACTTTDVATLKNSVAEEHFNLSTTVAAGRASGEAYTGTQTVCDSENECTVAGPVGPVRVDRQPPKIHLEQPVQGQLVLEGSTVAASYSCSDVGSGVQSCEASEPAGGSLETATLGEHVFAVAASDGAGNTASRVVHYTVVEGGNCGVESVCETGAGAHEAPGLNAIGVSPQRFSAEADSQNVTVSMQVADPLAGTAAVAATFTNGATAYSGQAALTSGTRLEGTWTATVTFPRGAPKGSYQLSVSAIDNVGNEHTYTPTELAERQLENSVEQTGEGGMAPPTVTEARISRESAATCESSQSVEAAITAVAGSSPIQAVSAELSGPGGEDLLGTAQLAEGTASSGVWKVSFTLPRYSHRGSWTLSVTALSAGGSTYVSAAQLQLAGFASSLEQTCTGDEAPPVISSVAINPSSINTSGGSQTTTVEVAAHDNLSGVGKVTASLADGARLYSAEAHLLSGTAQSGVWDAPIVLPRWTLQGKWKLTLTASNAVGSSVNLTGAQLAKAGITASEPLLEQIGEEDITPPVSEGFTVVPERIDTEQAARQVQVRVTLADQPAGVADAVVRFIAPDGQKVEGTAKREEEGSAQRGIWQATLNFPKASDEGTWKLTIEAWDFAGNQLVIGDATSAGASGLHDAPPPPPTVSALGTSAGLTHGGTEVTIEGEGFEEVSGVTFGAAAAAKYTVESPTRITATAPEYTASSPTAVNVRVATTGGHSAASSKAQFTYVPPGPPPTVKKLSAKKGVAAGGNTITITGTGFEWVTGITFGTSVVKTYTVNSNSSITLTVPPDVAGGTEIHVATLNGITSGSKTKYTFGPPTIASVAPAEGPKAGGTAVTIEGSGFAPGKAQMTFSIDKVALTSVACLSFSKCTGTTAAASKAGSYAVAAVVGKAKSKTSAGIFTYR